MNMKTMQTVSDIEIVNIMELELNDPHIKSLI